MNEFENLGCKECAAKERIINELYRLLDKTEKFHWFLTDGLENEIQKLQNEIIKQNHYIKSLENILREKSLKEGKNLKEDKNE